MGIVLVHSTSGSYGLLFDWFLGRIAGMVVYSEGTVSPLTQMKFWISTRTNGFHEFGAGSLGEVL
jgi:hypothetical protein